MASDPRIMQYIREQMGAGFRRQQIYEALLDSGWYRQEIEQAFYEVANLDYVPVTGPAPEKGVRVEKTPSSHRKAIAALIILISIVVLLFALPVLFPGTFLDVLNPINPLMFMGVNKAVTGFGELGAPSSWQYSYDGSFSITLKNSAPEAINMNSVTANCGSGGEDVALETLDPMHIEPGGSITYSTGNEKCGLREPGESYSVSLAARYLQGDIPKTASGTVTGKIQG